ncbi:sporulation protein YqfD [Sporolactobacillus sp. Y61]|uniref:Sporulation protein YqfD n=1 Tax=Sporolactobacillus sp. Y61 TaxID=3160863 RepID=A0AAU8IEX8_9BACL
MKNRIQQSTSRLKVEIKGDQPERFLAVCRTLGIPLWQVRRINGTTLVCTLPVQNPSTLKRLVKKSGCRIHIIKKTGIAFSWRKIQIQIGSVIGIFFFIFILIILSNMVWSVQIKGADPELEERIRTLLKEQHLYVGTLDIFVPDSGQIEDSLTSSLTKVTWIGVSREGTTYHIDVVQKKYAEKKKPAGPRNLIAAKPAVIHQMFVEKGQPVVESSQFVRRGQLLVSGRTGSDKSPKFVSSEGKVIGETWYQSETSVPLTSRYSLYTGKSSKQYRLSFWNVQIPLWGLKSKPYNTFNKETVKKKVRFLLWELPVTWSRTLYREKKVSERRLTQEEALEEAKRTAVTKLLGRLPQGAKVVSTKVDQKAQSGNGELVVKSHHVVYEDIVRPQALDPAAEKKKEGGKK